MAMGRFIFEEHTTGGSTPVGKRATKMKPPAESELVDVIVQWLAKNSSMNGGSRVEITGDTDLMQSELLDSLGFVSLMMFVESQTGRKIDLSDVDPQEFSVIKGLSRIALSNGANVGLAK